MGIETVWRTQAGAELDRVSDPRSVLSRYTTSSDRQGTVCLRFLDPYGDACFNQLQIPGLAEEFEAAARQATDPDLREQLLAVARLAKRARDVHTYLWFIGD
jgi:hypothetical protein